MSNRPQVICIPGGVARAADRYAPLQAAIDGNADLHLKDLEVPEHARSLIEMWERPESG
jgi:hypothetical protein